MTRLIKYKENVNAALRENLSIIAGISIAAALVVLIFSDLFTTGRIWAEEGASFMAYILRHEHVRSISQIVYLHNGHWDLWTNLAAYLARSSLANSGLIFTWMAIVPHILTATCMSRFAVSMLTRKIKYYHYLCFLIGILALLVDTFAGGVEVFITTTNTQWILSVFIFFSVCLNISAERSERGGLGAIFRLVVDALVILSSFAGVILFPIQIICFAALGCSAGNISNLVGNLILYSKKNLGFLIGFLIQAVTTLLFSGDSTNGRSLDILDAFKGFFVQGVAGLIIPPQGALEGLASTVKSNDIFFFIFGTILFIFMISTLLGLTKYRSAHFATLYLVTFIFCQLALGDKTDLISASGGMRYFATARICIIWLLIAELIQNSTTEQGAPVNLALLSLIGLIGLSSAMHFDTNTLRAYGILPGECQEKTAKSLRRLNNGTFNPEKGIPICPTGWRIPTLLN